MMPIEEATDVKGLPVSPGDRVSVKTYPRGTVRGTVIVSDRVKCIGPDGVERAALMVRTEDGTVYNLPGPKGVRKLIGS